MSCLIPGLSSPREDTLHACPSLVFSGDSSLAVRVNVHVQPHRMAAHRTVLYIVLMGPAGDVDGNDDLFAAGIADVRRLGMGDWLPAAASWSLLCHDRMNCSPVAP